MFQYQQVSTPVICLGTPAPHHGPSHPTEICNISLWRAAGDTIQNRRLKVALEMFSFPYFVLETPWPVFSLLTCWRTSGVQMCAYLSNNTASCLQREGWGSAYLSKKGWRKSTLTNMAYFLMTSTHFFPLKRTRGGNVTLSVFYWGFKMLAEVGGKSQHW